MDESTLSDIKNGINDGSFAFFLGAGFSEPMGYPTSTQLALDLQNHFVDTVLKSSTFPKGTTMSLSETVKNLLSRNIERSVIEKHIRELYKPDKAKVGQNTYFLLKTILDKVENKIIIFTTNWDDAIDNVFGDTDTTYIRSSQDYSVLIGELQSNKSKKITIIKLHGDISKINEKLIITEDDVRNTFTQRKNLYKSFAGISSIHRLILIGYSLGDEDIISEYKSIREDVNVKSDFLLVKGNPDDVNIINFENEFQSLKIIPNTDAMSFLYDLMPLNYVEPESELNLYNKVDIQIDTASRQKKSFIVISCKYAGKSMALRRCRGPRKLPNDYLVLDIPLSSTIDDYKNFIEKIELSKQKGLCLAIFMSANHFNYFDKLSRENKQYPNGIFSEFDYEIINLKVDEDNALVLLSKYLGETKIKIKNYETHAANILKYALKEEYDTYVPAILFARARRIKENLILNMSKGEAEHQKIIQNEMALLESSKNNVDYLFTVLGFDLGFIINKGNIKLAGHVNSIIGGILGEFSFVKPEITAALFGASLFFGFWEWNKEKKSKEKRNILQTLIDGSTYWKKLEEEEKRFLCYDIEYKNNLEPGAAYEILNMMFDRL